MCFKWILEASKNQNQKLLRPPIEHSQKPYTFAPRLLTVSVTADTTFIGKITCPSGQAGPCANAYRFAGTVGGRTHGSLFFHLITLSQCDQTKRFNSGKNLPNPTLPRRGVKASDQTLSNKSSWPRPASLRNATTLWTPCAKVPFSATWTP